MIDGNCHPFSVAPKAFDPALITLDIHPDPDRPRRLAETGRARAMQEMLLARLAVWLGCDQDEVGAVRAERASRDWPGYVASLFNEADLTDLVMDVSYPPGAADSISTFAALSGCRVFPTKRIDTELDEGIAAGASAQEIWQCVHDAMVTAAPSVVAFKSIIAYRTGLAVDPDADERAGNASLTSGPLLRRRGKACRDWIMRQALGLAAELNRPMQIHTGLGDLDLRLGEADPSLLEPLLATAEARACRIVLIHASYPWHEKLAALVTAHERVWGDLSMTNLYSSMTYAARLERLVELAPSTKLMLGTDGHDEPEIFLFGAHVIKEAWASVEPRLHQAGMPLARIRALKQSMFEANARQLYGL